jgi:hypothetical protein
MTLTVKFNDLSDDKKIDLINHAINSMDIEDMQDYIFEHMYNDYENLTIIFDDSESLEHITDLD